MTISFKSTNKEVKSILEKIEKQQLTVGSYLQEFILNKKKEEGKEVKTVRDYMESQRQYVWEGWRASNLIQSLLLGIPIPEIIEYRHDDKSQFSKVLDGQQRLTSIYLFVKNQFKLDLSKSIFPAFSIEGEQYTYMDLQGKLFSQLPELLQDAIKNYDLRITTINNCDEDQAEKFFVSMNVGVKTLKAAEVRAAAMGMSTRRFLVEILKSDWIPHVLSEKTAKGNTGKEVIAQFITLLQNNGAVELSKENIDKVIYSFRSGGIPEKMRKNILNVCEYLNKVTLIWIENKKRDDAQRTTKAGKKITDYDTYRFSFFNKTHIVMLLVAAERAIKNNVAVNIFTDWAFTFFKDKTNKDYEKGATNDTNGKVNESHKVDMRMLAIYDEVDRLERQEIEDDMNTGEEQPEELEFENEQDQERDTYEDQDEQQEKRILTLVESDAEQQGAEAV